MSYTQFIFTLWPMRVQTTKEQLEIFEDATTELMMGGDMVRCASTEARSSSSFPKSPLIAAIIMHGYWRYVNLGAALRSSSSKS